MNPRSAAATCAGVAAGAVALAIPFLGMPFLADIDFRVCALAMVAVSWNMMAGAGLVSLGQSAFWGLGSYVAILCANDFAAPFAVSLLPALAAGALLGAGLARITGRLRGIYFAISTLATSEGLRVLATMLPDLTGGGNGLYLDSTLFPGNTAISLAAPCGAILAALIAWAISRSRYAFALRAMRNNEAASQMLGVAPIRFRMAVMTVAGAIASLAGAINAWHGGYLDPGVAFDLKTTIDAQIAPILGGVYTLPGPIIGAVATIGFEELTRALFGGLVGISLLVFGIVLVVVVLFLPQGIFGLLLRTRRKSRPGMVRAAP
jgi:branched-chain amino acid transport system permease protein